MATWICNRDGDVVRRSRNLRGIIEHARRVGVKTITCTPHPDMGGMYLVRFLYNNSDVGAATFADWRVLKTWVAARRSWAARIVAETPNHNGGPNTYIVWHTA